MDGRISVLPMALQSVWQDTALFAARRMQPHVLGAAASVSSPPPDGTPVLKSAPRDDSGTYNRLGAIGSASGIYAAASWRRTDSVELQVRTAEGDVATLSFSQSDSASLAAGMAGTADGPAGALAWDSGEEAELSIQVEGDLNEAEQAAIDALAERVSDLAGEFFDGDMDVAAQMASELSIDNETDTLSAFSYVMRSTEVLAASLQVDGLELESETPADPGVIVPVPVGSTESANASTGLSPNAMLQQLLALLERLNADAEAFAPSGA